MSGSVPAKFSGRNPEETLLLVKFLEKKSEEIAAEDPETIPKETPGGICEEIP